MAQTKNPTLYVASLLACHARGMISEYLLLIRKPFNLDPEKEISQDKRRAAYERLNNVVVSLQEIFRKRHPEELSFPDQKILCTLYPLGSLDLGVEKLQRNWQALYRKLNVRREDLGRKDELLDWQEKDMDVITQRIKSKVLEQQKKQTAKAKQKEEDEQPRLF